MEGPLVVLSMLVLAEAAAGCPGLKETEDPVSGRIYRSVTTDLSRGWSFRLATGAGEHVVRATVAFPKEVTSAPLEAGDALDLVLASGHRVTLGAREPVEASVRAETELVLYSAYPTKTTTNYSSLYSPVYVASERMFASLAEQPLKAIRVEIGGRYHTRLLEGSDRRRIMRAAACLTR